MPFCGECGARNGPESAHCASCHAPLDGNNPGVLGSTLTVPTRRSRDEELAQRPMKDSRAPSTLPAQSPPMRASPGAGRVGATTIHVETHDLTGTSTIPPAAAEPKNPERALGKTMVGLSPLPPGLTPEPVERTDPAPEVQEKGPGRPLSSLAQTTVGMGLEPIDVTFESEARPDPKTNRFSGTMIGLPARVDLLAAQSGTTRESERPLGGTILGVARPGIAPTGDVLPASAKAFATTPGMVGSPFYGSDVSSAPEARESTPTPEHSSPSPRARAKAMWFVLGVLGAAALGAGLAWVTRPGYSVRVSRFETTADGSDFIVLECADCPNDTSLRIGQNIAPLRAGKARISAGRKLNVGQNEMDLFVEVPASEPERITLSVPVAFRVDTSLKDLMSENPRALIQVNAPEDAKVKIQGQAVPLAGAVATFEVPLGAEASGFMDAATPVEQTVPIVVERDGRAKTTEARVSAYVVPLRLTSPADGHVLQGGPLLVSGRTAKNATVTALDQQVKAGPDGEFSLVLERAKPGPLVITAREEQSIGRRGTLNLAAEETRAPEELPFSRWSSGLWTRIEGRVVEARAGGGTRLVVDVAGGCDTAPCLASVSFGERVELESGDPVQAVGVVTASKPPRLLASSLTARKSKGE